MARLFLQAANHEDQKIIVKKCDQLKCNKYACTLLYNDATYTR